MTIRNRLAFQFMWLASLVLGGAFVVVHLLSSAYREEEFRTRMTDRGTTVAKLLIEVEEVDQRLLSKIEQTSPVRLPEEEVVIFDRDDRPLFRSVGGGQPDLPADLPARVRDEGAVHTVVQGRETEAFLFQGPDEAYVVVVSGRDIYGTSKLNNQLRVMVATFLVGVLLTFLIGRLYAERALAPVQRLVENIGAIDERRLDRRLDVGDGHDEIATLARSFNALLDRLQLSINAQKAFIANASHELRTPLTAISGQLEVVLLQEREPAAYRAAIASVLEDMQALNRLSDRLLLLAQTDTEQAVLNRVPVRVDEVIWAARSDLQRKRPGYRVNVHMADPEGEDELSVMGNENLLRSLVFNLMENACKYSGDHTAEVHLSSTGGLLHLEVLDRGIGIPAHDRPNVFQPFFRAGNAAHVKGHGIGLSLVQRIAQLHQGDIAFSERQGGGTVFTVELPSIATSSSFHPGLIRPSSPGGTFVASTNDNDHEGPSNEGRKGG